MLPSGLQSHVHLIALQQFLARLRGGTPTATAVAAAVSTQASSSSRHTARSFASDAGSENVAGDAQIQQIEQTAHQLGLDAMPLEDLKGLMSDTWEDIKKNRGDVAAVWRQPPRQRKLTYADLPGYEEVLTELVKAPQTYPHDTPKAPALDAGQWVDTHFKEAGLGMEPSSPFYVWRAWAARNLPQDQVETLLSLEKVMGDESTRSAFLKQAQHELARLWDWQQRRADLGLSPDLAPTAAAAAAAGGGSNGGSTSIADPAATAAAEADAAPQAAAAEDAAAAEAQAAAAAAAAALDAAESAAAAAATSGSESESESEGLGGLWSSRRASGSSSEDEDIAAAAAAAAAEFEGKGMLDILRVSGALQDTEEDAQASTAAAADDAAAAAADSAAAAATADGFDAMTAGGSLTAGAAAAAAAAGGLDSPWIEDVVDAPSSSSSKHHPVLRTWLKQEAAHRVALQQVQTKLRQGKITSERGKLRRLAAVPVRRYQPRADDDDIFLPCIPYGSKSVSSLLSNPDACRPVNPSKVAAQAAAVAAAAKRAAAAAAVGSSSSIEQGLVGFSPAGAAGVQESGSWSSMPLLDRTVLHEESLRRAAERLAARPKPQTPWQLLLDGYTFDLQQRPPTPAFDVLTSYLEVKYADVLLRKDTVQTLQRQMAAKTLEPGGWGGNSSGLYLASEVLEQPPAALTAAKTLSPAEKATITKTLDGLLGGKRYEQYRDAVLQLYCGGLVSWSELQQCWAAAQAGEELTGAAEAPVSIAADRQQLFNILSGSQPLQALGSSSSGSSSSQADPAAEAAARQAWEEAGKKLQAQWSSAAAASGSSGSSSSSTWWSGEPVSYEEAQQTWQQLLHLAGQSNGQTNGPRFAQVLLAGSSGSDAVLPQLQQLQAALERATGLSSSSLEALRAFGSSGSSSVAVGDVEQLQQLFAAPPSLEQLLQQHWQQVAQQELGRELSSSGPTWAQLWQLLQQLAVLHQQQQQQQRQAGDPAAAVDSTAAAAAAAGTDAAVLLEKYLRESEGVALTPPPYPGARRLLQWEQQLVLHAASGQTITPAELKVRMRVSAAELREETGLTQQAMDYLLTIAGPRYNPSTGVLAITCDRFSTREENRRWCLEVLHRLLQAAQARYPSKDFWVDSSAVGVAAGNPALAAVSAA